MGQEVHGNHIIGFSEKIFIWGEWAILDLKMTPDNSGSTLRSF